MRTYIPSHRLKRSWRSRPRRVNASNKNTPSMHHPQRQNVTTSMVGLKNSHIDKNLTQNGEPQESSWERRRRRRDSKQHWHSVVTQNNRRSISGGLADSRGPHTWGQRHKTTMPVLSHTTTEVLLAVWPTHLGSETHQHSAVTHNNRSTTGSLTHSRHPHTWGQRHKTTSTQCCHTQQQKYSWQSDTLQRPTHLGSETQNNNGHSAVTHNNRSTAGSLTHTPGVRDKTTLIVLSHTTTEAVLFVVWPTHLGSETHQHSAVTHNNRSTTGSLTHSRDPHTCGQRHINTVLSHTTTEVLLAVWPTQETHTPVVRDTSTQCCHTQQQKYYWQSDPLKRPTHLGSETHPYSAVIQNNWSTTGSLTHSRDQHTWGQRHIHTVLSHTTTEVLPAVWPTHLGSETKQHW